MDRPPGRHDDPHLIDALRRVGANLFTTLQHRLELFSIELGEAGARLVLTLVASIAALLLFAGTVLALSAWFAVALWPQLGSGVLGLIALIYALAGAALLWWLRAKLANEPPLLADTLAELRSDADYMRGEERS